MWLFSSKCKYEFIIFNELLWFFCVILELFVQFSKFKFLIVLDDDDERFVVGDSLILKDFGRVQQKKINFGVFLFLNFFCCFCLFRQ